MSLVTSHEVSEGFSALPRLVGPEQLDFFSVGGNRNSHGSILHFDTLYNVHVQTETVWLMWSSETYSAEVKQSSPPASFLCFWISSCYWSF